MTTQTPVQDNGHAQASPETTDRLSMLAAIKQTSTEITAKVGRGGRHVVYTTDQLEQYLIRLATGEVFTNDEFPAYEVEETGSYSDPYVCAYYPLSNLRGQLVKAGLIDSTKALAIGQTDKTKTACKMRWTGKRFDK